ncbi:zinc-ribbon domain-containing protein [uncultured Tateyamaria sp.]|uniref:zinc-ribbon domain-containing protein n=1 Tax=uncultured Tateyamaria sp. TaxID=455651 RepID=UPI002616B850|nr:zinc-ribbon domain-containing protein [uncultured Tateyamaria sp.]
MRLICPNCDAQYEVVDDVIPTDGRDVQCSNCGQTWFQHHPDNIPEPAEEAAQPADLQDPDDAPAEDEERVETPPEPKRREIDPSVADILRQEAELETKARAGETLESQPELGLPDAESDDQRRSREAQERTAKLRGEEGSGSTVSEAAATAAALGSRRDLLPDIEEINSTLRSSGDRQTGSSGPSSDIHATAVAPPSKSGFRRGFTLMILLAIILGAIYMMAPQIAQAVPQVDPYLSSYVAFVDTARAWLDGQVTALLTWLDRLASSAET